MGSSSQSSQSTQSESHYDPDFKNAVLDNYNRATRLADTARYTPYSGAYGGAVTNDSLGRAGGIASQLGGYSAPDMTASTYDAAGYAPSTYEGALYNPTMTTARGVTAGQLSNTDLSPYLNPYTNDVINASINSLNRQYGVDNAAAQAQATSAGAFGGSRSAVLQGLVNDNYQRNLNSTVAGLNQSNFSQAQQAAFQDIANRLSADEFTSGALNRANEYNAGATDAAQKANIDSINAAHQFNANAQNAAGQFYAGAQNAGGQFNAGARNAASAANQSASIQSAGVRQNAANLYGQLGTNQQTQENLLAQRAIDDYVRQQNWPIAIQQMLTQATAAIPNGTVGTSSSNGSSSSFGLSAPGFSPAGNLISL